MSYLFPTIHSERLLPNTDTQWYLCDGLLAERLLQVNVVSLEKRYERIHTEFIPKRETSPEIQLTSPRPGCYSSMTSTISVNVIV